MKVIDTKKSSKATVTGVMGFPTHQGDIKHLKVPNNVKLTQRFVIYIGRLSGHRTKLRISCYDKVNPVPEKSDEMKHKIQIFNDLSPRGVSPRKATPTFYDDEEIRAGKVSEIVASFSSIPKTAKIDIDPKEWITSRYSIQF